MDSSPSNASNGSSAQPSGLARRPFEPVSPNVALWRLVRKYWVMILATTLAVAFAVTFYTVGQTKIYQASSTLQLDPNPPRPLGNKVETVVDMGNGSYWNNREYFETQFRLITSMRVATAVVRELGLDRDPGFVRNVASGEKVPPGPAPSVEDTAQILIGRLRVEPVRESRLATIVIEDADPARAQRVLAAVIDTYLEQNIDEALSSTSNAADWLHGQLDKLKDDLESSEMALHDFKMSNNILSVAFDDQSNMLREEMKQINEALTAARTRHQEVQARRDELRKVTADNPDDLPASEFLQSSLLQQLRQKYQEALRDRDSLLGAGKGPNYPDVKAANERVDDSKRALLGEVRNIQGALDRDVSILQRQEGGLSGLFERAKKQALDLNLMEIEYSRLLRNKDNTQRLYELVLERAKESDLTRMMRVNNIRVVDRAIAGKAPIRPRVPINVALGILFGLALGVALALGRDVLDRSLKTPDQVESELGLTALGILPEMAEKSEGAAPYGQRQRRKKGPRTAPNRELVVHELPMSGIAEAARSIRTNIMFMSPDRPYRTMLITSAAPAEGKTTVACCIAIAMAQAGQRVCLVDCDLRRPRLHRIFSRSNDVGITNALLDLDSVRLDSLATDIPNLSVLPSGPIPPNPAELLHSDSFKRVLEHLSTHFDRVIFDSPPIAAVTDAAILSTLTDATMVVVRAFKTSKDMCRLGVRSLADVGGNIAGVILNAVDLDRNEYSGYHYYYRRSYGGYGQTTEKGQAPIDPPDQPSAA